MKITIISVVSLLFISVSFFSCNCGDNANKADSTVITKHDSTNTTHTKTSPMWSPPVDQPITYGAAHQLIMNFQTLNPSPAVRHPSSFLLSASDLTAYFQGTTTDNPYLHIYFAATAKPLANNIFLVVVGATTDGQKIYHDPGMKYLIYSSTSYSDSNCGTRYDARLDGQDQFVGNVNKCPSLTINKAQKYLTVLGWITNYQEAYKQTDGHTQSFVINATSLRQYLFDADGAVKYLHVYIGYDPTNSAPDHLALVIVGIDENGNDIPAYYDGDNNSYAFDEVMPCPTCNAVKDNIDDQQQIILTNSRKIKAKVEHRK